jgi:Flp pilus assembly pilin Flp
MVSIYRGKRTRALWRDQSGQDLIEYSLLAAFIAVAVAAFLPPNVAPSVSAIFSKITNILGLIP